MRRSHGGTGLRCWRQACLKQEVQRVLGHVEYLQADCESKVSWDAGGDGDEAAANMEQILVGKLRKQHVPRKKSS